ncbi:MAG TPA: type II secretion system protein N [Sphingomonadaceae bacterium]|nr:type II secretion system protein N [Sphingomonadaceae bacterium]
MRRREYFIFAVVFATALVLLLPMRLALGWMRLDALGLGVRATGGSVWRGRLEGASLGGMPLGNLSAGLALPPLLVGHARINLHRDGFDGALGFTWRGAGIDDMTGEIPVAGLLAPLPIAALALSDASVWFEDGRCTRAEGRITAILRGDIAGMALPGGMSGALRCEGGALLLPLASRSGLERFTLSIDACGRYRGRIAIRPTIDGLDAALRGFGFRAVGADYRLTIDGRLASWPRRGQSPPK